MAKKKNSNSTSSNHLPKKRKLKQIENIIKNEASNKENEDQKDPIAKKPKYATNKFLGNLNEQKQTELIAIDNTPKKVEPRKNVIFELLDKKKQKEREKEREMEKNYDFVINEKEEVSTTGKEEVLIDEGCNRNSFKEEVEEDYENENMFQNEDPYVGEDFFFSSFPEETEMEEKYEDLYAQLDSNDKKEEMESKCEVEKENSKSNELKVIEITLGKSLDRVKKVMKTKYERQQALQMHKLHFLTILANRLWINQSLNNPELHALILSLYSHNIDLETVSIESIPLLINWLFSSFSLDSATPSFKSNNNVTNNEEVNETDFIDNVERIQKAIFRKIVTDLECVEIFVILCRCLEISARFVSSFEPVPFRSLSRFFGGKKGKENDTLYSDKKNYPTFWTEIFCEKENRWICVDVVRNLIDKPHLMISKITPYVIALDSDHIRDVTRRYAPNWDFTIKLRAHEDWIKATLRPYSKRENFTDEWEIRDGLETIELNEQKLLHELAFPSNQEGFRNHPLYLLERFVGKYQTIEPKKSLGLFKNQPVYSRKDLKDLHTKERWLQEGRIVKEAEEPIKKVQKARTKKEEALESDLYGEWQTEPYVPGEVVDGFIPKNQYNNVYLFKPEMLPKGAVHLTLPNLSSICRKIGIDFAPALVGWDHSTGKVVPRLQGIILAKDNETLVIDAWNQENERKIQERAKRKQQIAIKRWEHFARTLILKHQLKQKYLDPNNETTVISINLDNEENIDGKEELLESEEEVELKRKVSPTSKSNDSPSLMLNSQIFSNIQKKSKKTKPKKPTKTKSSNRKKINTNTQKPSQEEDTVNMEEIDENLSIADTPISNLKPIVEDFSEDSEED